MSNWQPQDVERWKIEDPRLGWKRILIDMTEQEIAELETQYGAPIRRPTEGEREAMKRALEHALEERQRREVQMVTNDN